MVDDWRGSDGRNVFQMIHDAGGVGIWLRRATWDEHVARVVGMGEPTGPPPYYGNPMVVIEVYTLDGVRHEALAALTTPGTHKTWRQVEAPSWASQIDLRNLDDPAIASAITAIKRKRVASPTARINLVVPFDRKDEAKSLGARWDGATKTWWLPTAGTASAQEKAKKLGFLPD